MTPDPFPAARGRTRTIGALLLCVVAAACTPAHPVSTVTFQPDAGGLGLSENSLRIDFGRAPAGVISILNRELGGHDALTLTGCPNTITDHIRWGDLVLTFTKERFVGWRQGGAFQGQVCA